MSLKQIAVVAAVGLALALGACSTGEAPALVPEVTETTPDEPTESPTETVTPEPEVPEVQVPEVGALVTQDQAQAARDAGYGVFITADGDLLVIDPEDAFPDVIIQEFWEIPHLNDLDNLTEANEFRDASLDLLDRAGQTGRIAVIIIKSASYDQHGNAYQDDYSAGSSDLDIMAAIGSAKTATLDVWSHDEIVALVDGIVANHPTPDLVEIIDTSTR